jgi:uncharacterized protein YbaR (Trm112 family)
VPDDQDAVQMSAQSLIDILACPKCGSAVLRRGGGLVCQVQGHAFDVVGDVPVMLPETLGRDVQHEKDLAVRDDYVVYVRQAIDAFTPGQVILDLGAGNRDTSNSSVVRSDIIITPFVDIVLDAHHLPFRDATIDFVHASAVFEHLKQPFTAAEEIFRVLKPGGHVYAECAFVYPFHGYPGMYFNASTEGMRSLFSKLDEVLIAVAPWQMPSFAVETLLAEYIRMFRPETDVEREFVDALKALDRFPIRSFDLRFTQAEAARIAAAVTYIGMKPLGDARPLVPAAVLERWERDPELRARHPNPHAILTTIQSDGVVDSLMLWAKRTGAGQFPKIAACFNEPRFSRSLTPQVKS